MWIRCSVGVEYRSITERRLRSSAYRGLISMASAFHSITRRHFAFDISYVPIKELTSTNPWKVICETGLGPVSCRAKPPAAFMKRQDPAVSCKRLHSPGRYQVVSRDSDSKEKKTHHWDFVFRVVLVTIQVRMLRRVAKTFWLLKTEDEGTVIFETSVTISTGQLNVTFQMICNLITESFLSFINSQTETHRTYGNPYQKPQTAHLNHFKTKINLHFI